MPDIERKGVSFSQALQEAAAIAPIGRAMLYTYELWHPNLTEPIRFVDDKADLLATLEDDAPRNAGEEVEFVSCPLASVQRPEESDAAAAPRIAMTRPDVGGLLRQAMDASRDSLEPWQMIERLYASDDTSRPARLPPRQVELLTTQIAAAAGSLDAGFDDEDQAIPALKFTRAEYPGLQR